MRGKNAAGLVVFLGSLVAVMTLMGNPAMFIDLPSAVLVLLGTAGLTALGSKPGQNWGQAGLRAADAGWKVGVLGMVIGIVGLLANLSEPSLIGPHAALALLSLLYGLLLSLLLKALVDAREEPG